MASKSEQLISSIHSMAEAKLCRSCCAIIVMMKRLRVFTSRFGEARGGIRRSIVFVPPDVAQIKFSESVLSGSGVCVLPFLIESEGGKLSLLLFDKALRAHTRSCAKSLKPSVALASLVCFYFYLHFSVHFHLSGLARSLTPEP
jgi:hypothetical protein